RASVRYECAYAAALALAVEGVAHVQSSRLQTRSRAHLALVSRARVLRRAYRRGAVRSAGGGDAGCAWRLRPGARGVSGAHRGRGGRGATRDGEGLEAAWGRWTRGEAVGRAPARAGVARRRALRRSHLRSAQAGIEEAAQTT